MYGILRVTVELVPFGDESLKREIAQATIWNRANNLPDGRHTYNGVVIRSPDPAFTERPSVEFVHALPHYRTAGCWSLIHRILGVAVNEPS